MVLKPGDREPDFKSPIVEIGERIVFPSIDANGDACGVDAKKSRLFAVAHQDGHAGVGNDADGQEAFADHKIGDRCLA